MQQMQAATEERLDRMLPVPELRPLGPSRFDLKINSNMPKTLFETLGTFAGINVLWDSDMTRRTLGHSRTAPSISRTPRSTKPWIICRS